jgi:uncharacterized protein (UPF0548 family)
MRGNAALDRLLGRQAEPRSLADLRDRDLNFRPAPREALLPQDGWHHDDSWQRLPGEPPGEPVPGASWETARGLIAGYRFAEGSSVRATFDPTAPLAGRDMLLTACFHGLCFRLGVRAGEVLDTMCERDGRRARVWGWSYRTLEAHLEQGEMDYQVWKWLGDGQVVFRIRAVSRRAPDVRNPIVRLGFALFGRREQLRFYRHVCREMVRLTGVVTPTAAAMPVLPPRGTASRRPRRRRAS